MNPPIWLSLALAAFLLPAPLGARTEEGLREAERRRERQLAAQRLAEAAEAVADCSHGSYGGAPADGSAWQADCLGNRPVLRGASWYNLPGDARVSYRFVYVTGYRLDNYR